MTDTIWVAVIGGIIGPIIVLTSKWYLDNKLGKKKKDIITDALEIGEQVITKLESIKEKYHADRVWITQFHNGGNFYPTGKSIAKFSMVYETVGAGIPSVQQNFQNIPVSLFNKSMNHLLENDLISIPDFKDDDTTTYGLEFVAETTGCKSGYLFAVKTLDNKFIGVLGLDYYKKKTKLTQEEVIDINRSSIALGGVLS